MALTAETITTTALEILSHYGLGDLSMRRLARELEVQPSALYWHVKNKQELLVLLARRMTAEVDRRCPTGTDPRAAVLAFREIMLDYRDGAEIVLLGYSLNEREVTPESLSPTAIGPERSAALVSFVLGAVAIEQNRRLLEVVADDETSFARGVSALLA